MGDGSAPEPLALDAPYSWENFVEAAQTFARSAATNYSREGAPFFYLHAGAAVELLVKAALCRNSPVLLLEGQRFSETSLLRLAGFQPAVPAAAKGPGPRSSRSSFPYTVGFSKAAERLGLLYGKDVLGVTDEQLSELKAARDLVAHGAHGAEEVTETMHRILVTLGTAGSALLGLLGVASSEFWGDSRLLIDRALDTERDAIGARIDALYAAARARYETQFRGIDPDALEALKEEAYWAAWTRGEGSRSCPICDAKGLSRERPELRRHLDRRGRIVLEPGFVAVDFRCPICKLVLDSEQLVKAARNFESWEEEVDDIGYWVDEFGPENLDAETRQLLGADWYDDVIQEEPED